MILKANEGIEHLRDEVLRLEDEGLAAKFDYQSCLPVFVARRPLPSNSVPSVASSERERLECPNCNPTARGMAFVTDKWIVAGIGKDEG